jgi:hypothetical protein
MGEQKLNQKNNNNILSIKKQNLNNMDTCMNVKVYNKILLFFWLSFCSPYSAGFSPQLIGNKSLYIYNE